MKQRDARYEFIRVVAMVLVIGVHALANTARHNAVDQFLRDVLATVFFLCNGLFFMLSGRFALARKFDGWDDYQNYYLKKLVGLGVPILVYMLIRTVYDAGWAFPARTIARNFTLNFLGYYFDSDFWFLYQLVGMLIIAPVLGKFFQQAGRKEILFLLLFTLGYNVASCSIGELDLPFEWRFPLGGDLFYFMLGYGIEQLVTDRKQERIVYVLGAASLLLAIVRTRLDAGSHINTNAPSYVCVLTAAFLGLKRLYRPGKTADRVFGWIGKYSMAVYMIHIVVLNWLVDVICLDSFLGQLTVVMGLTTVISLAWGWAVDHVIVYPIQKGMYSLLSRKRKA